MMQMPDLIKEKNNVDINLRLYRSFLKHSSNIALELDDSDWSYRELFKMYIGLKNAINNKYGPKSNHVIAFYGCRNLLNYALTLTCFLEGWTFVPLNRSNPINRVQLQVSQLKPTVLICMNGELELAKRLNLTLDILHLSEMEIIDYISKNEFDVSNFNEINLSQNAYIMFTSGSTGSPKGVPITFGNLNCFIDEYVNKLFIVNQTDRCTQTFENTFDLYMFDILNCWLNGACLIPFKNEDMTFLSKILIEKKITIAFMVPSATRLLSQKNILTNLNLNFALFCGEALTYDSVKIWNNYAKNAKLFNLYGPTELTIFCSHFEIDSKNIQNNFGFVSIGKLSSKADWILYDTETKKISSSKGELCVSGPMAFKRYLNNLDNEGKTLTINNKCYYKTGDICRLDQNKDLHFLSRSDNQVKINGYRVELSEIDSVIMKVLDSESSITLKISDNHLKTNLIAFVLNPKKKIVDYQVKLKHFLPHYMIPHELIELSKYPLNYNGKTDRKLLEKDWLNKGLNNV